MNLLIAWSLIGLLIVAGLFLLARIVRSKRKDRRAGRGHGKPSFIDLRTPH